MRPILAAVAVCLLVLPAAAQAAVSAAEAHAARLDLIAQSKAAEAASGPLNLKTPANQALISAAFDVGTLPQLASADLGTQLDTCGEGTQVLVQWMLHGLGRIDKARPQAEIAAEATHLAAANMALYQDEAAPGMRFQLTCLAGVVPSMEAFAAGLRPEQWTKARRDGIIQARGSVIQIFDGVIISATDPGLRTANRHIMLKAVADAAPAFARMMPITDRDRIASQAAAALPKVAGADDKAELGRIRAAMAGRDCVALCAVMP